MITLKAVGFAGIIAVTSLQAGRATYNFFVDRFTSSLVDPNLTPDVTAAWGF